MAAADRYTIHAVTINGTTFSGIRSYSVNANLEASFEPHDGLINPNFGAVLNQKPDVVIRTVDMAGLVAATGMAPLTITAITIFWQKRANCGTRASGSVHLKCVASSACAVLRPISATNNQITEAEIQIHMLSSDGLTNPWTWTDAVALSGTVQTVAHYTLGPVSIDPDGVTAAFAVPVTSWTFDPGINGETDSTDGLPFVDYYDVETIAPTFECTTPDVSLVMNALQTAQVAAVTFYLRKMSETGIGRVANATEEHISFTIADCVVHSPMLSGSAGQKAEQTIRLGATYDGSNAIAVIDFTAAIA